MCCDSYGSRRWMGDGRDGRWTVRFRISVTVALTRPGGFCTTGWSGAVPGAFPSAAWAGCVTAVADREGDLYEMFACRPEGVDVLVRAAQDRVLADGGGKLFDGLEGRPEEEHAVDLPARSQPVFLVEARELDPPAGGSSPLDHPALPQALDDRAAVPHHQDQRVRHRGRLQGDRPVPGPLRHDARRRRLLPATRSGQGRREQPPARADGPATTESQGP